MNADDVPRWRRGHEILKLGVVDIDRVRQLKLELEILQGVRRDDPAREIIFEHARHTAMHELPSARTLRDELLAAARREQAEMDDMIRRATDDKRE